MHMVADRSNHFSLISDEICSYKGLFDFGLDPRLGSLVLEHFLVLVAAIAIVENHLLVLVVRVGVSMRVRLRSVVRWQDTATGAITWVSKLIWNPSPSSLSHLTLSLSELSLLYFFWIFDKFKKDNMSLW